MAGGGSGQLTLLLLQASQSPPVSTMLGPASNPGLWGGSHERVTTPSVPVPVPVGTIDNFSRSAGSFSVSSPPLRWEEEMHLYWNGSSADPFGQCQSQSRNPSPELLMPVEVEPTVVPVGGYISSPTSELTVSTSLVSSSPSAMREKALACMREKVVTECLGYGGEVINMEDESSASQGHNNSTIADDDQNDEREGFCWDHLWSHCDVIEGVNPSLADYEVQQFGMDELEHVLTSSGCSDDNETLIPHPALSFPCSENEDTLTKKKKVGVAMGGEGRKRAACPELCHGMVASEISSDANRSKTKKVAGEGRKRGCPEMSHSTLETQISGCAIGGDGANAKKKVRRRNGTAMDPQSMAARSRRERFSDRIRMLQGLIPKGKRLDTVSMLGHTLEYIHFLQHRVHQLYHGSSSSSPDLAPLTPAQCQKWKDFLDAHYTS